MFKDKLSAFILISIEKNLDNNMDYNKIIGNIATMKLRQKNTVIVPVYISILFHFTHNLILIYNPPKLSKWKLNIKVQLFL